MLAHVALANVFKSQRLLIDDAEAEKLAKALEAVSSHYINIDVDPKTRDWISLVMVAGGIYAPRVIAASMETKKADPKPKPAPSELTPTNNGMTMADIPGIGKVQVPLQ